ncbi:UrcA family protein [Novosphingobium terrae]|uniref:UrcA family protein n=1 Tax=Novosphingobium terrae TaxID=2726189 RepID=UPI001980D6F1|nr:UrcA family protein [Novosphingobium terrae]
MNGCFRTLSRMGIVAAALILAVPMSFAQAVDHDGEAPHRDVHLSGLDLTQANDLGMARRRIAGAARSLCASLVDPDGFQIEHAACVLAAREQGAVQLEALHQKALAAAATTTKVQYAYQDRTEPSHKGN